MSYFNELAGGPKNGHKYILDSNIDWGQDVFALKKWIEKHPEAKNLHLLMRDDIAETLFLDKGYPKVPFTPDKPIQKIFEDDNYSCQIAPQPGWFVASIHQIHEKHGRYKYLLDIKPVDRIGYSIYIYHISLQEANQLRSRYSFPLIQEHRQDLEKR
ncbi:hypothetical protein FACS1894170_12360 [Planctomycetales bacterium]|nr:hypothetical protein FACS1894170_12360 [Planctomycetales bacterium]